MLALLNEKQTKLKIEKKTKNLFSSWKTQTTLAYEENIFYH